ncbi:uncharacterized protein [Procambarus clarkii]|uniref:uncharacterized protein isoform X1 n=1 Tax=Procambarus clarkii TaxID=6728 RepID=UPI0037431CE2
MHAKPPCRAALLLLLLLRVRTHATLSQETAESSQMQRRIIPPFSPSLELARALESSPVTPQGMEVPALESPKVAVPKMSTPLIGKQLQEGSRGASGASGTQDTYDRGLMYDKSEDITDDDDDMPPLGDLPLGEEDKEGGCPPRLPQGYISWRKATKVVRATLPHQVFSSCTPPLKCSVTTTVNRRVFLQGGDKLEVVLKTPPDYTPPTSTPPTSATPTLTTSEGSAAERYMDEQNSATEAPQPPPTTTQQPQEEPSLASPGEHQPLLHPSQLAPNTTHLFTRDDHLAPPPLRRRRRQVAGGAPPLLQSPVSSRRPGAVRLQLASRSGREDSPGKEDRKDGEPEEEPTSSASVKMEAGNQTSSSPLTIWKASVSEWASCSTREGSQVGESGPEGVVTVSARYLQVGTNYFIGEYLGS